MAALMGASDPMGIQAMKTLIRLYTTIETSDILNKKNIFELVELPDCLYESDPLNHLIHHHLRKEWFDWLQSPEAPYCYVVYTNYKNGEKVIVSPKDRGMTRERFIQALLASASVPVMMEATVIDQTICYDGGVRDLLPFGPAIDLGAETIVPIFLDPEKFEESQSRFSRMDKILLRTLDIMKDETRRNDYAMANLINIGIRSRKELLEIFGKDPSALDQMNQVFNKAEYASLYGPGRRLIKIIKGLMPDQNLAEDSLVFDPIQMSQWMAWGEQKAREILTESPFKK